MALKFDWHGRLNKPSTEHLWAFWFVQRLQHAAWIGGGLRRPKPYGRALEAVAIIYGLAVASESFLLTPEVVQWLRAIVYHTVHPGNRRLPKSAKKLQPQIEWMFGCVFDGIGNPNALRRLAKQILGCAAVDDIDRICSRLSFHVMANQVGRSLLSRDGGFRGAPVRQKPALDQVGHDIERQQSLTDKRNRVH